MFFHRHLEQWSNWPQMKDHGANWADMGPNTGRNRPECDRCWAKFCRRLWARIWVTGRASRVATTWSRRSPGSSAHSNVHKCHKNNLGRAGEHAMNMQTNVQDKVSPHGLAQEYAKSMLNTSFVPTFGAKLGLVGPNSTWPILTKTWSGFVKFGSIMPTFAPNLAQDLRLAHLSAGPRVEASTCTFCFSHFAAKPGSTPSQCRDISSHLTWGASTG